MFHAISNVDPSDFTRCYPEGKNKNSSEVGSRAISRDVIPKVKIKIRVRSGAECLRGKPLVRDKINRKISTSCWVAGTVKNPLVVLIVDPENLRERTIIIYG